MSDPEFARQRARSTYAIAAGFTGLWAFFELIRNHDFAAFFGLVASSLLAWIVRFLLTPDGVRQMLQAFEPKPPSAKP